MAKLVHSYWTLPSMGERWGFKCEQLFYNLWYFSLSVAYAKEVGAPIVLHTDTLGERLFSHLPYDDIKLTLDDVQAPPKFWAAGKFYAMQAEEDARAIHIDGDVFIKKAELWERMSQSDGDILVQCKENWVDEVQRDELAKRMRRDYFSGEFQYNTGVMGLFNAELKEKIIAEYMRTIREMRTKMSGYPYESPDLVCEQQMVAYRSNGYKVDTLYEWGDNKWAVDNGYQHVLSKQKYGCLTRCKDTLKRINRDIYNETKKICQKL